MNTILLKALMDDAKKEAQREDALQMVRGMAEDYYQGVRDAYNIENLSELGTPWSSNRIGQVITSRVKNMMNDPTVMAGRDAISSDEMEPLFVQLLRHQGVRDAFQGAREAEMQLPKFNNPLSVIGFFGRLERMLGGEPTPFNRNVAPQGTNKSAFDDMMKKVYGEKQGK